jgi:polyphosphate kinase
VSAMTDRYGKLRIESAHGDRERLFRRELSWLDWNARVLAEAENPDQPLLERAKFLAIFSRNLDEFFQIRVAGLKNRLAVGLSAKGDEAPPGELIEKIRSRVLELIGLQEEIFLKHLGPALAAAGVRFCEWDELESKDRRDLREVFQDHLFPVLTPLAVDPAHPFPYISNLSLNLAVELHDRPDAEARFARVKVPNILPRFLTLDDGSRLVALEQVIAAHLDELFPGMGVLSCAPFRVTRDGDIDIEAEETDDLRAAIESGVVRRLRMSDAVRLEIDENMSERSRNLLAGELRLSASDLYELKGPLDLGGLIALSQLDRPDLKDPTWRPVTAKALRPDAGASQVDFFERMRERSILVHHPYEAFESSVDAFLAQAADDPRVLAIKHTLYRTAGSENPFLHHLTRAALSGKQVVTLVELKARFDEEANIEWARTLERAGVHVVYGLVGLKTHSKVILVVREEDDGIRRYCHVGTGNYNPETAGLYEDLGLFSSDPDLGADLSQLFNQLTGFGRPLAFRKLRVAPYQLRAWLLGQIREQTEAGERGMISLKVNNLSDPEIIEALYSASRAGVKVQLMVRSVCCLRPGVLGRSENIQVRSVVGPFLEHSRIFRFGPAGEQGQHFIGSSDIMPRNLDRRVEVMVAVEESELSCQLDEIFEIHLHPDASRWELSSDGSWAFEAGKWHPQQRMRESASGLIST